MATKEQRRRVSRRLERMVRNSVSEMGGPCQRDKPMRKQPSSRRWQRSAQPPGWRGKAWIWAHLVAYHARFPYARWDRKEWGNLDPALKSACFEVRRNVLRECKKAFVAGANDQAERRVPASAPALGSPRNTP